MQLGHSIFGHTWPTRTNICCWWCTEPFDTCPLAIPNRISKGTVECYGVFCGYGCAKTYLMKDRSYMRDTMKRSTDLAWLFKELTGRRPTDEDLQAPPRQALTKFGGSLDIEDFRSGQYTKLRQCQLRFVPSDWNVISADKSRCTTEATYASKPAPKFNLQRPGTSKRLKTNTVDTYFKHA